MLPLVRRIARLRLSIEWRAGYTVVEGVLRRLTQQEWLERLRQLGELGGPCDVREWEQLTPRELTLLQKP